MRDEFCSGCDHSLAKHDLTTMAGSSTVYAKCRVCPCDGKISRA